MQVEPSLSALEDASQRLCWIDHLGSRGTGNIMLEVEKFVFWDI